MLEAIYSTTREDGDDADTGSTEEIPAPLTTAREGTDGESTGDQSTAVHLDQVFSILKNQRRRSVLKYMQSVDEEVRLGELSEQIAAWECDKPVEQITSSERKRVYVGLYQSHLPKMNDVHAIEYNKQRGKIRPGKNMATFNHYLPPDEEESTEREWSMYHVAIVIAAVSILLTFVLVAALA